MRMNGVRGEQGSYILDGAGDQMTAYHLVSGLIILIGDVAEKNDIEIRVPQVQFPEIFREADFEAYSDPDPEPVDLK